MPTILQLSGPNGRCRVDHDHPTPPGCTPEKALDALTVPVVLNLAGYVIGTLVLSPIADTIGRRNMPLITMLVTGVGSLCNALAPRYANFVIARVITGIGIAPTWPS